MNNVLKLSVFIFGLLVSGFSLCMQQGINLYRQQQPGASRFQGKGNPKKVKFFDVKKESDAKAQNNIKLLEHPCFKGESSRVQGELFKNDHYKQLPPHIFFSIERIVKESFTSSKDYDRVITLYHKTLRPEARCMVFEQYHILMGVEDISNGENSKLDRMLNDPDANDCQISAQVYDCRVASIRKKSAEIKMIDMCVAFDELDYPAVIGIAQNNRQMIHCHPEPEYFPMHYDVD